MELNKKGRIAFFALILITCTACIGITIAIQMNKHYEKEIEIQNEFENSNFYEVDQELFRSKFINSFNNKLVGEKVNVPQIDETKDVIYTEIIQEKIESKYNFNINIPVININNEDIKKYNEEINSLFKNKLVEIKKSNVEVIYTVDYMANISNNILSLVIKATLKEGENSQRLIIKTYNYDIKEEKEVDLKQIIANRNLKIKEFQSKLKEAVQQQNKEAKELQSLGYNVFIRNIKDDMFEIENINTFFIDSEGYVYVIYAYGNNNLTTEMDIVIF